MARAKTPGPFPAAAWSRFVGKDVVVDTDSSFCYMGRLEAADDWFLQLSVADVHDRQEGASTKERYIMDARKHGVRANRKEVFVLRSRVVSISVMEDVINY